MLFEGSKKHFEDELKNFIQLIVPTLNMAHPKVLYASMTCIALLAVEFSPDLQIDYHQLIVPPTINILKNSPHLKIKLRSVSMMISYFREMLQCDDDERAFMDVYSEEILSCLVQYFEEAFKNNNMPMIEETLSLISILAATMSDKFAPFYKNLMPGLKNLLNTVPNDNDSQNKVRSLTISTMGYLLGSFRTNPQEIEGDITEIMDELIKMTQKLPKEDGQHKSILEVYEVLLGSLQEKFLPYMNAVLEHTLSCARRDIGLTVEDHIATDDKKPTDKAENSIMLDLKILGGKKILSMDHG